MTIVRAPPSLPILLVFKLITKSKFDHMMRRHQIWQILLAQKFYMIPKRKK